MKRNKKITKKEKKSELINEMDLLAIIAISIILIVIFIYPSITGLTIYTQSSYNYTFSNPGDYTYNSLIIIENNSAQLKLQEIIYNYTTINSTEFYIISAFYNGNDKTSKFIALDNNKHTVKVDKTLDILFENNIQNNDIIALYLIKDHSKEGKVFLCDTSIFCENDYGSVYFPAVNGWYNITINNLASQTNNLSILTNNSIKFDYLKVIRETEQLHSETNYSYPESTFLETSNLELPTTNQNILFSSNEQLNQQQINYYYSNDNGLNYTLIPENGSLPSIQQIKIKVEFNSDTISTPILNNMALTYESCTESWNCSSWSNCLNENQTRICLDLNECGSLDNKPIEIQNCTIEEIPQETSSPSSSSGGSGGSTTFTRPTETKTKITPIETKPTETPTLKQETQEIPLEIETKTPLQKVTGFVSYNIEREGINIILLTFLVSLSGLLYFKSKIKIS